VEGQRKTRHGNKENTFPTSMTNFRTHSSGDVW